MSCNHVLSMHPSSPGAPRRLEELVVEALVACLDEMEAVSSALLAVLLQCFLDTVSSERAKGWPRKGCGLLTRPSTYGGASGLKPPGC